MKSTIFLMTVLTLSVICAPVAKAGCRERLIADANVNKSPVDADFNYEIIYGELREDVACGILGESVQETNTGAPESWHEMNLKFLKNFTVEGFKDVRFKGGRYKFGDIRNADAQLVLGDTPNCYLAIDASNPAGYQVEVSPEASLRIERVEYSGRDIFFHLNESLRLFCMNIGGRNTNRSAIESVMGNLVEITHDDGWLE
jgi:hypothetical protein